MRNAGTITRAVLALVLCSTLIWTGCSTAWVGTGEEIVAALIPAAANIVTLVAALQGKSVSEAICRRSRMQDAGWGGFTADFVSDCGVSEGGCGDPAGDSQSD